MEYHSETTTHFSESDVPFKTIIFGFQVHYYLPSGTNFKCIEASKQNSWPQPDTGKVWSPSSLQYKFLFKIMFFTRRTLVPVLGSFVKYKVEVIKCLGATSAISKIISPLYLTAEIKFQKLIGMSADIETRGSHYAAVRKVHGP